MEKQAAAMETFAPGVNSFFKSSLTKVVILSNTGMRSFLAMIFPFFYMFKFIASVRQNVHDIADIAFQHLANPF